MRYLTLEEIFLLHGKIIAQSGGLEGCRDVGALESAVVQPFVTFGDTELYPDIAEKASALCYSLVMNHPFIDGNKRIGHFAMAVFLALNGYEIEAEIDDQEQLILNLADGKLKRNDLTTWIKTHLINANQGDSNA